MTFFMALLVWSVQASGAPAAPPAQELGVKSFPATFTIVCDPPARIDNNTRVDQSKLTYTVAVDRGQPSAPSASCKFTITIEKAGLHHVDVTARYARADGTFSTSTPAVLDFTAKIVAPPAAPPAEVRVTAPPPPSAAAAASGQEKPPVPAPFTDPEGHRWTLVGTEVRMDGRHAPDAGACTRLILASGKVYAFGLDLWWLWRPSASPHWTSAGPNMPR